MNKQIRRVDHRQQTTILTGHQHILLYQVQPEDTTGHLLGTTNIEKVELVKSDNYNASCMQCRCQNSGSLRSGKGC